MIKIDHNLTAADLLPAIARMWEASAGKIHAIERAFPAGSGTPVITRAGKYVAQGWTEWTQGFQFGSAILQYDATDDEAFLTIGRDNTINRMAAHVTHMGVHDHGFNNISTYGGLRRLMIEGRIAQNERELQLYELALKCSGAVQAARWSVIHEDGGNAGGQPGGFIHSFNGPQSLFSDTIRSLRSLALAHQLGHALMGENDAAISLLGRLFDHARATAQYNVYYGEGRDRYDTPDTAGRVVHESIFNPNDGRYRCPSTQQGYSPFSTWTRGLAWIITGYAEQLEYLASLRDDDLAPHGGREALETMMRRAAKATCDFYIRHTPTCGVPYWDTGAPGIAPGITKIPHVLDKPADPFNDHEPVDASAAAIAAQGLLRFGRYLQSFDDDTLNKDGHSYWQAGLTVIRTLMDEPYLSMSDQHHGLLLHTVYHQPRGWDHIPPGAKVPRGESCMWGDYHLREAALYVQRVARDERYLTFF